MSDSSNRELDERIRKVPDSIGGVSFNVKIEQEHRAIPQVKFGRPLEDVEPLFKRKEYLKNMIIRQVERPLK